MTEPTSTHGDGEAHSSGLKKRLRVWPAILVVAFYLVTLMVTLQLPTIFMNAVGVIVAPILATLLLALWWLFFSRAPWRDRLAGVALLAVTLAVIWLTHEQEGSNLLLVAMPAIVIGITIASVLTARASAPIRRVALILVLVISVVVFSMLRVVDITSSLAPVVAWRWTTASDDALQSTSMAPPRNGTPQIPAQAGPQDWPGFRGPARDARVEGVMFGTDWAANPPEELWRRRVGVGYSSFAVVGDYAFTQDQRQAYEMVVCYRASTGEEIWRNAVEAHFEDSTGSGPRATPTFDGGNLYILGATGYLQCLDAATGDVSWRKDLMTEAETSLPTWGFASSPLVTDRVVIVFAGGKNGKSVLAFDKTTGAKIWHGGNGSSGYASAQISIIENVPQILMTSSFGVQSLAMDTGAVLWENQWEVKMNPRVVQPTVYDGDTILVGTAEGKGTRCLQVTNTDTTWNVEEKWTTKRFRPYFNDFVFHKDFCYGFDGNTFTCIDARTGDRRWKGSQYGGQVLLLPDMDTLLVLAEKGQVALVRANPVAFEEITQFNALNGKTWNHPVIANGKLFVRNAEEAACFQLPPVTSAGHVE